MHTEVSRHADYNGTSLKVIQWSICEKTHFEIKHHFPLYLEGQTQVYPGVFRHADPNGTGFKVVWWSISEKTHFGIKHHFPLYLEGQTKCILRFPGMPITLVQVSKLYNDPFLKKKTHFGIKHHFPLYLEGQTQVYPEVFRHADPNGTGFKVVWWSISEKTHFGIKHHFPLYLEGQTQQTLRFSGVSIAMVQVSKPYDDLFLQKHILE